MQKNDTIYSTLWSGFLKYEGYISIALNYYQNSNRELDDLLAEICDVNFGVDIYDNTINITVCSDFRYYYYDFEKTFGIAIIEIEKKFNITIYDGEFYATEMIHQGSQYKYTISKYYNDNQSIDRKRY